MAREIVFKFRDAVLLTPSHSLFNTFKVGDSYYDYAAAFIKQAGIEPINTRPFFEPTRSIKFSPSPFLRLIDYLIGKTGAVSEHLFLKVPVDVPLRLLTAIQRPERDQYRRFRPKSTLADQPDQELHASITNLYNYFTIRLPDGYPTEEVLDLLARFGAFLPLYDQKRPLTFFSPATHLFDYVYLKNDPAPMGFTTPLAASENGRVNQTYLTAMNIPAPVVTTPATSMGVSVLEAHGWFAAHSQFGTAPNFDLVNPLAPPLTNYDLLKPGGYPSLSDHGTAILGVLRATNTDKGVQPNQDLCRGIVPQATIRLASCTTHLELNPTPNTNPKKEVYNEAAGLLQLIDRSNRGDVILIEVGAGGEAFPLDATPAIYELLRVANLKEITVVAAAGNKSRYLPGSATDPKAAAFRSNLVSLDSSVKIPNHSASYMAEYQALLAQIMAELAVLQPDGHFTPYSTPDEFAAAYLGSGSHAILVGAAHEFPTNKTANGMAQKMPTSSWGPRVKVYAQGENILTTTYGGPASPNEFKSIGETSGASAIIAGFVAALQIRAKSAGYLIKPDEMANLLTHGIPVNKRVTSAAGAEVGEYTQPTGGVIPDFAQAALALDGMIAAHAGG